MEKFKVRLSDGDVFYVNGDRISYSSDGVGIIMPDRTTIAIFPIGTSVVKFSAITEGD